MHHLRTRTRAGDCWISRRGTKGDSYSWQSNRWTKHFPAVLVVIGEHLAARHCTHHPASQSPDSRQRALPASANPTVLAATKAASNSPRAIGGGCALWPTNTQYARINCRRCSDSSTTCKPSSSINSSRQRERHHRSLQHLPL